MKMAKSKQKKRKRSSAKPIIRMDRFSRQKAARELLRKSTLEYYSANYGENQNETIDRAKRGDRSAIIQLVEWDKSFLLEDYAIGEIMAAERQLIEFPKHKNKARKKEVEDHKFLKDIGRAIAKIARLPKLKRYWPLLLTFQEYARANEGITVEQLIDAAREARKRLPDSPEYELLFDEKAKLRRFVKKYKHFIFS